MLKQRIDSLPKSNPKDKNKKYELSYTSQNILDQRKEAANTRNPQLLLQLNQQFIKSRRDDKQTRIIESLSKELDIRDRWLGIRELKRKYNPTPFHNKNAQGQHIQHKQRAQEAARYLSEQQWGTSTEAETQNIITTPIIPSNTDTYDTDYPTLIEIGRAIKKLKRRKAPGPDDIPTELLKEMQEDNIKEIQNYSKNGGTMKTLKQRN